ncbi:hypothetical protein CWE15_10465 [Aliidiomarina taiwanensis]|uniref:Uncharacterized protein n=1 Tax=Aliidiomarina taiwanensis TaxID=946228 RepID=A0A432WYT7_9GAMM|nr:hypothetical protein CWE15_10465 [Aliidiomarina taiwanensis]
MRKRILVGGASLFAVFSAVSLTMPAPQQCLDVFNGVQKTTCTASTTKQSITWHAWVKGQSSSVQFHFLDLVELMFSPHVSETTQKQTSQENKSRFF